MRPTACLIIIGNEILSGRTQDKNLSWLAAQLNEIGVGLSECRVIPDVEQVIVDTLNACRANFTYVFTTGGIGPTHDDITTAAVAKAFGLPVIRHAQALKALQAHYASQDLNEARLKMADVPEGATLISNPVSAAPGYSVENVYVMAGVPRIMQAMFDGLKSQLKGGAKVHSRTLSAYITEGVIAGALTQVQQHYPDIEIGSYPFMREGRLGTSLVARGSDVARLDKAARAIEDMLTSFDVECFTEQAA